MAKKQKQRPAGTDDTTKPLSLRVPSKLKTRLEDAAKRNGRTVSLESVGRLQSSFDFEARVREMYRDVGGQKNLELIKQVSELAKALKDVAGHEWTDHAWVTEQLAQGAAELVRNLGAKGKAAEPELKKRFSGNKADVGKVLAQFVALTFDPRTIPSVEE